MIGRSLVWICVAPLHMLETSKHCQWQLFCFPWSWKLLFSSSFNFFKKSLIICEFLVTSLGDIYQQSLINLKIPNIILSQAMMRHVILSFLGAKIALPDRCSVSHMVWNGLGNLFGYWKTSNWKVHKEPVNQLQPLLMGHSPLFWLYTLWLMVLMSGLKWSTLTWHMRISCAGCSKNFLEHV